METKSSICFLFLLCCGLELTYATGYDGQLCQEKAAIFDRLTRRLTQVLTGRERRNSIICPKLAGYISHALYTELTCSDLPLVRNSTFLNTVSLMRNDFETRCNTGDYNIVVSPCSPAMVHFVVNRCNKYVDLVQFYLPRLEVCQIGKDFIDCHKESLRQCLNSPLFEEYHVAEAMELTRESLDFLCNESLADEPWEHGPEGHRNARSVGSISRLISPVLVKRAEAETSLTARSPKVMTDLNIPNEEGSIDDTGKMLDPHCPDEIKNGRSVSDVCTERKEMLQDVTLESRFEEICRVFRFMHSCATDLFERCANTTPEEEKSYFLDNFQTVYTAYGCSPS